MTGILRAVLSISAATETDPGSMSAADKTKLDMLVTNPTIDFAYASTQSAGPITGPDAWTNLLSVVVGTNNAQLDVEAFIAYRSESNAPNPINAKFRITIDGVEFHAQACPPSRMPRIKSDIDRVRVTAPA